MAEKFLYSDVDELIRNIELRAEIDPFYDESFSCVEVKNLPLEKENAYLADMLAWEKSPVQPIAQWFEPAIELPQPETLTNDELSILLNELIEKLYEKNICLDFTSHLSDRELYRIIMRDILPVQEKNIPNRTSEIHWDLSRCNNDWTHWLMYYASDAERYYWAECHDEPLPEKAVPLYPRFMPHELF